MSKRSKGCHDMSKFASGRELYSSAWTIYDTLQFNDEQQHWQHEACQDQVSPESSFINTDDTDLQAHSVAAIENPSKNDGVS